MKPPSDVGLRVHLLPVEKVSERDVVLGAALGIEAGRKLKIPERPAHAQCPRQQIDFVEDWFGRRPATGCSHAPWTRSDRSFSTV